MTYGIVIDEHNDDKYDGDDYDYDSTYGKVIDEHNDDK